MPVLRKAAVGLCVISFAVVSMGADSCSEATKDLNEASEQLEDISGDNDAQYRQKMKQVRLGMSQDEVRLIMGKPRDKQKFETSYGKSESWYYGSWQLNFEDGTLDSKNRY